MNNELLTCLAMLILVLCGFGLGLIVNVFRTKKRRRK